LSHTGQHLQGELPFSTHIFSLQEIERLFSFGYVNRLHHPLAYQPFPDPFMLRLVFGFHIFQNFLKPGFMPDTV
jgi:hypothetical protein